MDMTFLTKNYSQYIYILFGAVLAFIGKYLYNRLFEKKVDLVHEISKPTEFISKPFNIYFQNLRITNKGTVPANNLRTYMKSEYLKEYGVSYGVSQDTIYNEEISEASMALIFHKLIPKEELNISFKSNSLLPKDFIISIKSDEMISIDKATPQTTFFGFIFTLILVIASLVGFFYGFDTTLKYIDEARNPLIVEMSTDKTIYKRGDKIHINSWVQAKKDNTLRDLSIYIEVPGIKLDRMKFIKEANSLIYGDKEVFDTIVSIPKDLPVGKYAIWLKVFAKTLDKTHLKDKHIYIDIE